MRYSCFQNLFVSLTLCMSNVLGGNDNLPKMINDLMNDNSTRATQTSTWDIQLCNQSNQGDCNCGFDTIKTYVFYPGQYIRCIHTFIPSGASNLPVLISIDGYGQGNIMPWDQRVEKARYYGYAIIGLGSTGPNDGAGGFGLEFPANRVITPSNPAPCSASDSRDYNYIKGALDFIADDPALDESKIYVEGFSQSSMYTAYVGFCFADRIKGIWQGGSGLGKTYHVPILPGLEAQCSLSSWQQLGEDCCETNFCNECFVWPVYPRTCNNNKITNCIAMYTNDFACGTDWYMYEAMVQEGHDARMLSFQPNSSYGGHDNPQNFESWLVGCLGIVDSCSSTCENSFLNCMQQSGGNDSTSNFAACEEELKEGNLSGCVSGCAPTFEMLNTSETPIVNLSQGKFGSQSGLSVATNPQMPNCESEFGSFDSVPEFRWRNQCNAPNGSGPATGIIADICTDETTSPISTPISTSTPTPTPPPIEVGGCVDSSLRFLVNGRSRTCNWVQSKNTEKRCAKGGNAVSTHCPFTCDRCALNQCGDATKRFYLTNGNLKSCTWVKRKDTTSRCAKSGVLETCRETCNYCP